MHNSLTFENLKTGEVKIYTCISSLIGIGDDQSYKANGIDSVFELSSLDDVKTISFVYKGLVIKLPTKVWVPIKATT